MSETKTPADKKLSVGKTLTLKRGVEQGVVRQSFSHGRSKQVVVEKVKRRVIGGPGEAREAAPAAEIPKKRPASAPAAVAKPAAAAMPTVASPTTAPKPSGVVLRTLSDEERKARTSALADARVREAEERKIAEEEARRRANRHVSEQAEREAAEARKRDEDDRHRREEEAKRKAEQEAKKRFGEDALARPGARLTLEADDDDGPRTARRGAGGVARPAVAPRPTRPGVQNSAAASPSSRRCAPTKCASAPSPPSAAARSG